MCKEEILNALENFKDRDGISFMDANPESGQIIRSALSVYYATIFPPPIWDHSDSNHNVKFSEEEAHHIIEMAKRLL